MSVLMLSLQANVGRKGVGDSWERSSLDGVLDCALILFRDFPFYRKEGEGGGFFNHTRVGRARIQTSRCYFLC